MVEVKNMNDLERPSDDKTLEGMLCKLNSREVRDPYCFFKPEETPSGKFTVGYAILYPGCRTNGHTHDDVEEIYHIVRGSGNMTIGDSTFEIKQGDTFVVPLHKFHSTENTGNTPIEIFWVLVNIK